jgi:hypothetical protein
MIEKKNVTGTASFNYIKEQLKLGKSLSKVLNKLALEEGEVLAFVPNDISEKKLYNFNIGGIYPLKKELSTIKNILPVRNDSKIILIDEITSYIDLDKSNCCIFEDSLTHITDPVLLSSGLEFISFNNEDIYYFFNWENNRKEEIYKGLIRSENYIFLCVLSSINSEDQLSLKSSVNIYLSTLDHIADKLTAFFIRAYDGEGYLMWHKV